MCVAVRCLTAGWYNLVGITIYDCLGESGRGARRSRFVSTTDKKIIRCSVNKVPNRPRPRAIDL